MFGLFEELKCSRCGTKHKRGDDMKLSALVFNFLEGSPCICEKCLAGILGIKHPKWIQCVEDRIEK
jgi:hypothetical protein